MDEIGTAFAPEGPWAHLFGGTPDALLVLDEGGAIRLVNARAERLLGYDRADLIGRAVEVLVPDPAEAAYAAIRRRFCSREASPLPARVELTARRSDGSTLTTDVALNTVDLDGARWLTAAIRYLPDQSLASRSHLASLLAEAQESERKRIAEDIHDDSIQVLTVVRLRLHQLRSRIEARDVVELLDRIEADVELATERLRQLAFALSPRSLHAEGLVPALQTLFSQLTEGTSISGVLEAGPGPGPGPAAREVLFRVAREALTNVRKHSGATSVRVVVKADAGGWLMTIADDGVGILKDEAGSEPTHFGIPAMRERAEGAGGWLSIETAASKGSIVKVLVRGEDS